MTRGRPAWSAVGAVSIVLAACGAPTSPLQDSGGRVEQDGGPPDLGVDVDDAGPADAGPADAGEIEVVCGQPGEMIGTWTELQALAGCTRFLGRIFANGQIPSLEPLQDLRVIEGGLALVSGSRLTSLRGLESLERADHVDIRLPELSSLEGLDSLRTLEVQLRISGTRISDLRGLENLESTGELFVSANDELTSLRALERLQVIQGDLAFIQNDALLREEFDWLSSRVEVGGLTVFR